MKSVIQSVGDIKTLLEILHSGVNVIKLSISILRTISPYFRKMENKSLDKKLKYGVNICKMEIGSLITLAPACKFLFCHF